MKKKILKILSFLGLFFLFLGHTFALEASLDLDKKVSNINDYLNLRLQISSDDLSSIKQIKIDGIDNFEKLGQSQSQSSSSQIVIINGKTQQKTTTTVNLDLTLKPLKTGEFEIGPAIIGTGSGEIKTNTIKVKIDGTNIGVGTNNLIIGNNKVKQNKIIPKQNIGNNINKIQKKEEINLDNYKGNNYELYILILLLLLSGIGFYFLLKNKNENNLGQTQGLPLQKKSRGESCVHPNTELQDFEEKQEIIYPEINDKDFIKKAEIALRQKLEQKFNIKNIDSLTFNEIEKEIQDKLDLKELFAMINKAKYSNIITDYSKILEKIKEI